MKRKKLFFGAFSVGLALIMAVSIYTRVHADPPAEEPCIKYDDPAENKMRATTSPTTECYKCVTTGDPYPWESPDHIKFIRTPRGSESYDVDLMACQTHTGSYCIRSFKNPAYTEPTCNDLLSFAPATGTE